ncbi:MAG: hypothetical protein BWK80_23120 [Desulfobacteraceae bacterium IS3]|nr:MAG: hypothetical protein BWK80_23120 [Desulfobacteraceae bacterium IS3]
MPVSEQCLVQLQNVKVSQRTVNRNIKDLLRDFESQEITIPPYQRTFIWDVTTKSRFIESILMDIPIPPIFLLEKIESQSGEVRYEVIDGAQRLNTLKAFKFGDFKISNLLKLPDLNRTKYDDLPPAMRTILLSRQLQIIIIEKTTNPDIQFEIFERLNQGSVSLNAQELRNCMFHGEFNDFLLNLRNNKLYRELLKPFPKFKIVPLGKPDKNRFLDVEMILRFFALYESFIVSDDGKFMPPTKDMLNFYMAMKSKRSMNNNVELGKMSSAYSISTEKLESLFSKVLQIIKMTFKDNQFRRFKVKQDEAKFDSFNKAIFDIQLLGFANLEISDIQDKTEIIYENFLDISSYNSAFIDTVTYSTNQKINERISIWNNALNSILKDQKPYIEKVMLKKNKFNNSPICEYCNKSINDIDESDYIEKQLVHRCCHYKNILPDMSGRNYNSDLWYLEQRRRSLSNPDSFPSKIKKYLMENKEVTFGELKRVSIEEFGYSENSGSFSASVKLLEVDGYTNSLSK